MYRFAFLLASVSVAIAATANVNSAMAETGQLFFDDFDGPGLDSAWEASFSNVSFGGGFGPMVYKGAANHYFQNLGPHTVLRMTNTLNNHERVGWSTSATLPADSFRYETRINADTISDVKH
jgi:hypothetical protein